MNLDALSFEVLERAPLHPLLPLLAIVTESQQKPGAMRLLRILTVDAVMTINRVVEIRHRALEQGIDLFEAELLDEEERGHRLKQWHAPPPLKALAQRELYAVLGRLESIINRVPPALLASYLRYNSITFGPPRLESR